MYHDMIYGNGIVGERTKGEKKKTHAKPWWQQQRGDRDFRSLITALINFVRFPLSLLQVVRCKRRVYKGVWATDGTEPRFRGTFARDDPATHLR